MRIDNNMGYREIEKLGDILKELGNTGRYKGKEFDADSLEITYNPSYDRFELFDGNVNFTVDMCEI